MSRAPARCTQADITRAIKAVAQTGGRMGIKIDREGNIVLLPIDLMALDPPSTTHDDKNSDLDNGEVIPL